MICLSIHVPLPCCISYRDIVVCDYLIDLFLLHSFSFLVLLRKFLMVLMICRLLSSLTHISSFHASGTCVWMRKRKQCFWAFISVFLSLPMHTSFPGDSVNVGSVDRQPQSDFHSWFSCSSPVILDKFPQSLSLSFLIYRVGKMAPSTE